MGHEFYPDSTAGDANTQGDYLAHGYVTTKQWYQVSTSRFWVQILGSFYFIILILDCVMNKIRILKLNIYMKKLKF